MLKIVANENREEQKCTPNLLPCRIHHDGPVSTPAQYWKPEATQDGRLEAYLRGRKLQGKTIALPSGYEGIVVEGGGVSKQRDGQARGTVPAGDENDEEDDEREVRLLNETGNFDEIVVWEHGKVVESDDAFVKGLEEWIGFAEKIHNIGETTTETQR